jgi:hypothetical protein
MLDLVRAATAATERKSPGSAAADADANVTLAALTGMLPPAHLLQQQQQQQPAGAPLRPASSGAAAAGGKLPPLQPGRVAGSASAKPATNRAVAPPAAVPVVVPVPPIPEPLPNQHTYQFARVPGPRPFVCRFPGCGAAFGTANVAVRHARTHKEAPAFFSATDTDPYLHSLWKSVGLDDVLRAANKEGLALHRLAHAARAHCDGGAGQQGAAAAVGGSHE